MSSFTRVKGCVAGNNPFVGIKFESVIFIRIHSEHLSSFNGQFRHLILVQNILLQ